MNAEVKPARFPKSDGFGRDLTEPGLAAAAVLPIRRPPLGRQGNATNHARAAAGGRQAGDQAARGEIWPFIWSGLIWLVWLLVLIGYLVARLIDRRRRRRQVRDSIARLIARQKQTNPAFAEAAEAAEAAEQRRARILSIRGRR